MRLSGRKGALVGLVGCALLAAPAGAIAHGQLESALLGIAGEDSAATAAPVRAEGCPSAADPATFADTDRMLALNKVMADYGPRPTGSRNHERFIEWLRERMSSLPGMQMETLGFDFDRWTERRSQIELLGGSRSSVRVSSAVPYAEATGAKGVTAPIAYVPAESEISDQDVGGKIVVRDFVPVSVPNAAFTALEWWSYDPDLTLTKTIADNYERDWLSGQREVDLEAAAAGGAAGLVFVHGFPHEQVAGHYAPYPGIRWEVPAVYVGADEGEQLKQAASAGSSASLKLTAAEGPATTHALVATLPGASDERLVVASHTDGINAVWDNGPISMLAMAEHFASLPQECRPRTLQFIFTTAHLFQSLQGGTAWAFAQQLDAQYDQGSVAAVLAVEHMGARNYVAVPREGHPGRELVPSGLNEPNSFFIGESPTLIESVLQAVVSDDLRGTIALRGADLPGPYIPPHRSFGGEGGPYQRRLIPTIAFITGPWTLFNPAFSLDQVLDPELLRHQTLVFADIVHNLEVIPREALGGTYLGYREARSLICSSALADFGLAECEAEIPQP
jgi:hypothetical protein